MPDQEKNISLITLDEIKTLKEYGDFYYIIEDGLKVAVDFVNRDNETLVVSVKPDDIHYLQDSIELADAVNLELEIKDAGFAMTDGMYELYDEKGKVVIRLRYETYNNRSVIDLI